MYYLSPNELTKNIQEIVLDNPNHIKEFIYNCGWSGIEVEQLACILRNETPFPEDIITSLCDRGAI